jgi:murein peptide amidase A
MASITGIALTLTAALVVGHSVLARPIELVHRAGPGPRVLVVGCVHGNECAALPVVLKLAGMRPAHEDLWLVPTLNPDGVAAGTRGNAHGVDLNRTFPGGGEPETRAAVALIRRLHPDVTIWFHQPQGLVRAWGRSQAIARRYAKLTDMRFGRVEWPAGAATRWQNVALGERSFVVELPPGRLGARDVDRHVRAVLRLTLAAP